MTCAKKSQVFFREQGKHGAALEAQHVEDGRRVHGGFGQRRARLVQQHLPAVVELVVVCSAHVDKMHVGDGDVSSLEEAMQLYTLLCIQRKTYSHICI